MLVLSRQRGESIKIGDDVEITIIQIGTEKVRLGVTAPRAVQVHRREVWNDIQEAAIKKKEK